HRYLLEAAQRIIANRDDVYFLLLGDGELRGDLTSAIKSRGLGDRVLLLGSRADAIEIVRLLDIFVLSSIREGLSIALLEAMALERAVVVTAVGGSVDLIRDGYSGFLVPPRDGRALAQALERVLNEPGLKEKLGRVAGEDVISNYNINTMVQEYERLYREIYKNRK
ncbi:MAG: glycosyltransferase, partial [Candidatus Auribacterota bacterium]|nr:glycosyltransferase [Candidatus Auribacterota bacterium]